MFQHANYAVILIFSLVICFSFTWSLSSYLRPPRLGHDELPRGRGPHGRPIDGITGYENPWEAAWRQDKPESSYEQSLTSSMESLDKEGSPTGEDGEKIEFGFEIMLVGGSTRHEGTVIVNVKGRWGVICDDNWTLKEANVVCKQLGYSYALRATTLDFFHTSGQYSYVMDDVHCKGNETNIGSCNHWKEHDCTFREEAGVVCSGHLEESNLIEYDPLSPRLPGIDFAESERMRQQSFQVHFVRAFTNGAGILIVRMQLPHGANSRSSTTTVVGGVCADRFHGAEANVACRAAGMGLAHSYIQADLTDPVFTHRGPIIKVGHCYGNESSLNECVMFANPKGVSCSSPRKGVAVRCTGNNQQGVRASFRPSLSTQPISQPQPLLPDLEPDVAQLESSAYATFVPLRQMTCALEENCFPPNVYSLISRQPQQAYASYRRLLRFNSVIYNKGTAAFRPHEPRENWIWHACHRHYHSMKIFSLYQVLNAERRVMAVGHKASFCLEDNACRMGYSKHFVCSTTLSNRGEQGISPGCHDNYLHDYDCQWIDITDVPPGKYIFRASFNPEALVPESNYANNAIICALHIADIRASVHLSECRLGHAIEI